MTDDAKTELIERQRSPLNLESPLPALTDSFLTPNNLFYVRNHFSIPEISAADWQLRVEGAVERPQTIAYDQLRQWPGQELTVTLECAGNHRAVLRPKAKGVAWERGAVSTARWAGIPLHEVLNACGVTSKAVDVIFVGSDAGIVPDEPKQPPAGTQFSYSIPVERALRGNVLLAYEMNGEELPQEHGFPLRAIVPGCFGMASAKWLKSIVVSDSPFRGYFNTLDYAVWHSDAQNVKHRVALGEMPPKSMINSPGHLDLVPVNGHFAIKGSAWGGDAPIVRVEVSTDEGKSWRDAQFIGDAVPHAWRFWQFAWPAPRLRGATVILARAIDADGRMQASAHDPNNGPYVIDHSLPLKVYVRG